MDDALVETLAPRTRRRAKGRAVSAGVRGPLLDLRAGMMGEQ